MIGAIRVLCLTGTLLLSACASTFVSTWKAPDAAPLELRGQKVAAVVMMKNEASRRAAEDTLARDITARGAQGVAAYTIVPEITPGKEAAARAALEKAGVQGIVVMRPLAVDKKIVEKPNTYLEPEYSSFFDGYYGMGSGQQYAAPVSLGNQVRSEITVTVETLVYSMKQNKLVWSGRSKTTDPEDVDALLHTIAAATAKELTKQKLIREE